MSRPEVVIVGGGPAGLSAAVELRRRGVGVVVLEREQRAGGVPRHTAHLGYGMRDLHRLTTGPRYARRLVRDAERAGADLRTGVTVTGLDGLRVHTVSRNGPETMEAAAVVLATGVRERPRAARLVPGDRPAGVLTTGALQQFTAMHRQAVGHRAVVVGAEHVSFSAVLTLAHAGCEVVAMTTPHDRHQSYTALAWAAAGRRKVPVLVGVDVAEIVGRDRVQEVVLTDGRRLACDTVVFTGDWVPEHEVARRAGLPMVPDAKSPVVDAGLHTEQPGVFAIGNLIHPAETADVCALDGRHVAPAVLDWLTLQVWPDHVRRVTWDPPVAWANWSSSGLSTRVTHECRGRLELTHGGEVQWTSKDRTWLPNRSIIIRNEEMTTSAEPAPDDHFHLRFVG